jgi:uncharacterized protein YlzI (FlbEa/FlbD family)
MCLILLTFISGATIWVNPEYIRTVQPLKDNSSEVGLHQADSIVVQEQAKCVMYKARYCKDLNPNIVPDVCKIKETK